MAQQQPAQRFRAASAAPDGPGRTRADQGERRGRSACTAVRAKPPGDGPNELARTSPFLLPAPVVASWWAIATAARNSQSGVARRAESRPPITKHLASCRVGFGRLGIEAAHVARLQGAHDGGNGSTAGCRWAGTGPSDQHQCAPRAPAGPVRGSLQREHPALPDPASFVSNACSPRSFPGRLFAPLDQSRESRAMAELLTGLIVCGACNAR